MTWMPAVEYKAIIGGVLYRNVAQPIVCNGKSLISLVRNIETGQLSANFKLARQDTTPVASIENNVVTLNAEDDYTVIQGPNRVAVIEKRNGSIWCDLRNVTGRAEYELAVSCLLFSETGFPILLHPDRSKFGTANDNRAPNIAFLSLSTNPHNSGGAIALGNTPFYLLGIAIENYSVGIQITDQRQNAPDRAGTNSPKGS